MMTLTWNYENSPVFQMSDWIRNRLLLPTDTAWSQNKGLKEQGDCLSGRNGTSWHDH